MARAKKSVAEKSAGRGAKSSGGRGSPEAVQKRLVARRFNDLLSGKSSGEGAIDGRSERRRKRLLDELKKGTGRAAKKPMKPLDVLKHVDELLSLGETVSSIRKVASKLAVPALEADAAVSMLREVHAAYGFRREVYSFLGLPHDVLVAAKLRDADAPRRGRPPKKSTAS